MNIHVAPHLSEVLRDTTRPPSDPRLAVAGRCLHLRDLLSLAEAEYIGSPCRCKGDLMHRMRNALTLLASNTKQNCMKPLILPACPEVGLGATTWPSLGSSELLLVRTGSPGRSLKMAQSFLTVCRRGRVFACAISHWKAAAWSEQSLMGILHPYPGRFPSHVYAMHARPESSIPIVASHLQVLEHRPKLYIISSVSPACTYFKLLSCLIPAAK